MVLYTRDPKRAVHWLWRSAETWFPRWSKAWAWLGYCVCSHWVLGPFLFFTEENGQIQKEDPTEFEIHVLFTYRGLFIKVVMKVVSFPEHHKEITSQVGHLGKGPIHNIKLTLQQPQLHIFYFPRSNLGSVASTASNWPVRLRLSLNECRAAVPKLWKSDCNSCVLTFINTEQQGTERSGLMAKHTVHMGLINVSLLSVFHKWVLNARKLWHV